MPVPKQHISDSSKLNYYLNKIYAINHKKLFSAFFIVVFSLTAVFYFTKEVLQTNPTDFYAYYTGAKLLLHNRAHLYDPDTQNETQRKLFGGQHNFKDGFMAFFGLPLSAVMYIPFSVLDPETTGKLSQPLSFLMIIYCIYRLYQFHKVKPISFTTLTLAYFLPIYSSVHLGQIAVLLFLIITEMYIAYIKRQTTKLALLGSLLTLKYQYFVLIPLVFTIYPDKKTYLRTVLISTLSMLLINLLLVGGDHLRQYFDLIKQVQSSPAKLQVESKFGMDVFSMVYFFFGDYLNFNTFKIMLVGLAFIHLVVFLLLYKYRNKFKPGADIFYLVLIYSMVFSPHTMAADHIFLIIPIIGLLSRIKSPYLSVVTATIFGFYFLISSQGIQWSHTILLLLYTPVLLASALIHPGKIGRKIQILIAQETL